MRTWEAVQRYQRENALMALSCVGGEREIRRRALDRRFGLFPRDRCGEVRFHHDLHHFATGYDTSLRGQVELAAWELASGGCREDLFLWVDRLGAILLGILLMPIVVARAYQRGELCSNLYGIDPEQILNLDFAEVLDFMGLYEEWMLH